MLYSAAVLLHHNSRRLHDDQCSTQSRAAVLPPIHRDALPAIGAKPNKTDTHPLQNRRESLLALLDAAIAPGRVVQALAAVGITAEDLSVALDANPRTTAAWLTGPPAEIRKKAHRERIRELKEVTRFIIDTGTIAEQEADWLRDPNRSADFRSPLELIRQGDWKKAGRLYCDDIAAEVPPQFRGGHLPLRSAS